MTTLRTTTSSILTTVSRSADAATKVVDTLASGINIAHAHAQKAERIAIETIADEIPEAISRKRIELALNHHKFMKSVNQQLSDPEDKKAFDAILKTLTDRANK